MSIQAMDQFPLSLSQRRSWLMGDAGRRFTGCVAEVTGCLDLVRLRRSVCQVVDKHSILRTVYELQAGFSQPFQSILDDTGYFGFTFTDRSAYGLTIEDIRAAYLPAKGIPEGPPLQIEVIRLEEQKFALVILIPAMSGDSLSILQLIRQLADAYGLGDRFETHHTAQYFHFSEWHNDLVKNGSKEAGDFWKPYIQLAGDRPGFSFGIRDDEPGRRRSKHILTSRTIDAPLTAALRDLAAAGDAEVETILMTSFAILVSRHGNKERCVAGRVNNMRGYEELQTVIGLIGRTLPATIAIEPDGTYWSLLKEMKEEWERVTAWEDYFNPGSDDPYLQWIFEYNRVDDIPVQPGCPSFAIRHLDTVRDRFDLKWSCLDFGSTIELCIYTDTAVILDGAAETLAGQYVTLLQSVTDSPGIPISQHRLLGKKEGYTITRHFSPGARTAVPGLSIATAFEETARANTLTVAVRYGDTKWTYGQLDAKANQVAHYLRYQYNIGYGDTVALWMPRSADWIAAMLGIIKTGACYLPLDSLSPAARIKVILEDSGAGLIITGGELPGLAIPQLVYDMVAIPQLVYDMVAPAAGSGAAAPPERVNDIHAPVYIIYTSGSTGSPKGVAIAHTSLLNYCRWLVDHTGLPRNSHTLLLSSPAFDLCYTSLWTSLLSGHTLSILRESAHPEPGELIHSLIHDRIDYIKCTPSHFNMLIHHPDFEKAWPQFSLSLIVLGGEAVMIKDMETWLRYRPETTFLHHYGPTETTIGTIAQLVTKSNFPAFSRRVVLGRPITNSSVYILDEQGRLCPTGCAGQIAVAGKGVAIGYINAADLNRRKFVDNPFQESSCMYLTGDMGRWMPDGSVEFLGRTDQQLKVRGYRIEPGEIENALLKDDRIKKAVILPMRLDNGEISLTACLVSADRPDIAQLTDLLSGLIPAYMIPDRYAWVDAIPLTANGKADKRLLMEMAASRQPDVPFIPPFTILEKKLALIWTDVLGKEKIGLKDDFFRMGGHSLKATQLISRIFKTLGYRLRLSDVFQYPTLGELAAAIHDRDRAKYAPICPVKPGTSYELSHAQRRLWVLDQLGEHQVAYNMHSACWIDGELDRPALEKALEWVIRRHEILRTSFPAIDGVPRQRIHAYEDGDFRLRFLNLRHEDDPGAAAIQYSRNALDHAFDLAAGPVIRAVLLQTGHSSYAFLLTLHHIVSDGWSMRILMNEIIAAYNGFFPEPLRVQYRDYAAWHNQAITGSDEAWWNEKMKYPPPLVNLPREKFRPAVDEPYVKRRLDEEITRSLKALAGSHRSTLSNIMLTVYALLVHKITGAQDFLIGMGHANRNHGDIESLVGFFVNLLPIRIRIEEEDTIGQIIANITATCIEAFDHADYPFDLLVEKFCHDRYSTRQPLVNVMYDFKGYADVLLENEQPAGHGLRITPMPSMRIDPKFDLTLFVTEVDRRIEYYFEYDPNVFSAGTIARFFKGYDQLIGLILEKDAVGQ